MLSLTRIGLVVVAIGRLWGQQADAGFEATDVRPSKPPESEMSIQLQPGGRLSVTSATFRQLVLFAYYDLPKDVLNKFANNLVSGGPHWIDADYFDVVAKAPNSSSPATVKQMLRGVLAERFQFACHREDRRVEAFALELAKGKPKLQQAAKSNNPPCVRAISNSAMLRESCAATMAELAHALPSLAPYYIDRPVVDHTHLQGAFDFELDWMPARADAVLPANANSAAPAVTIYQALGKLGLKLKAGKQSVSIVVIDHVERPPAN